jgi:hypothetical protein
MKLPLIPPVTSADVSDEWICIVAGILRRDGHAIRGGAGNTLEVQHPNRPDEWGKVMLPSNGFDFVTAEERDLVLHRIERAVVQEG